MMNALPYSVLPSNRPATEGMIRCKERRIGIFTVISVYLIISFGIYNKQQDEMDKIKNTYLPIIGAICCDILGSQYELKGHRTKCLNLDLCQDGDRFTDDTVCTVAITQALQEKLDVAQCLKYWCRRYSEVGYGHAFKQWIKSDSLSPYSGWGNGSAMRVSAAVTLPLFDVRSATENDLLDVWCK